jgi:hypothetical protein
MIRSIPRLSVLSSDMRETQYAQWECVSLGSHGQFVALSLRPEAQIALAFVPHFRIYFYPVILCPLKKFESFLIVSSEHGFKNKLIISSYHYY